MYQVVTGKWLNLSGSLDLHEDEFAEPGSPSTDGLWIGEIIERCWTEGGYAHANGLAGEWEAFELDEEIETGEEIELDERM